MKQFYFLTTLFLLNLTNLNAQTTFNWDTAPINNVGNITETINGITTTFTGLSTTSFFDPGGFGGSSGNIVISSSASTASTSVSFSFSEAVDVVSILALEGLVGVNVDFTFTPVGGSNSPVIASLVDRAAAVNLNWTDVTSFTVSSEGSVFGFDNLIIGTALSTDDFALKTIKIFPNPSTNFIQVSGLSEAENYKIYTILGTQVLNGNVSDDEKIDVQNLIKGLYFLQFDAGKTIKFIKQ